MDEVKVELTDGSGYSLVLTGESDDDGDSCIAACVFDGDTRGPADTDEAVVRLARDHGFNTPDTSSDDAFLDAVDDATDYLNKLAPDGYSFGFDGGSFYLANDAWWAMVNA
jgi:hypothetical protein